MEAPMPLDAPVTTATLPASFFVMLLLICLFFAGSCLFRWKQNRITQEFFRGFLAGRRNEHASVRAILHPLEFKPRFGEDIVPILCARMSFRQVRRVRRNVVHS